MITKPDGRLRTAGPPRWHPDRTVPRVLCGLEADMGDPAQVGRVAYRVSFHAPFPPGEIVIWVYPAAADGAYSARLRCWYRPGDGSPAVTGRHDDPCPGASGDPRAAGEHAEDLAAWLYSGDGAQAALAAIFGRDGRP